MTTLTNFETKLLDNYIINNNYTEFSEAHFYHAIANIVPTWRSEQIADSRVYDFGPALAYQNYIKNLYSNKSV